MATATQVIREIVATQPSAAAILERFEIDLCSQGNERLEQACAELQLSIDQVLEKLADADLQEQGKPNFDPATISLYRLIQHIVRAHHHTVRKELPRLVEMARKVAAQHGGRAPELAKLAAVLEELRVDMLAHLGKEEQVLFPYIAQLCQDPQLAYLPPQHCFETLARPVFVMAQEHESAERLLMSIQALSHDFEPPSWACATYLAFCGELRTFKNNLHEHLKLENEVLFPRAMAMECAAGLGR